MKEQMELLSDSEQMKLKRQALRQAKMEAEKQAEQKVFDNKEELIDFHEDTDEMEDWSTVEQFS